MTIKSDFKFPFFFFFNLCTPTKVVMPVGQKGLLKVKEWEDFSEEEGQ